MSINRITRERLYKDEALFNELLPFAKYDEVNEVFLHVDASLWVLYELEPLWITATSDEQAFDVSKSLQEIFDSLDPEISVQFNSITTFDSDNLINTALNSYPLAGTSGWLANRWLEFLRKTTQNESYASRPKQIRLIVGFRFDPPWTKRGFLENLKDTFRVLFKTHKVSIPERQKEYQNYVSEFKGKINGLVSKFADLRLRPYKIDGQYLIDILHPILNRRSSKRSKSKRGRTTQVMPPEFDNADILANQMSETPCHHIEDGLIKKDGFYFRSVSMVKPPKQCLPIMLSALQASPYENILSVTYSKDPIESQLNRLDMLDNSLGFREYTSFGRSNQKIMHQIQSVRSARDELYNRSSQIVRAGVHQTFITKTPEEAKRAASEAVATMPLLNGARGMVHEISDMGVLVNSLPGCYDPELDGPGWTSSYQSSRAVRLFPIYGNWKGSPNKQIVLPSVWNRELVGFDLFDASTAPNTLISGVSGAGKSYLLCFLVSMLNRGHYSASHEGDILAKPPITFIFDKGMPGQPCGFDKLARMFNGRIYEASPSKAPAMNFLYRLGLAEIDGSNDDLQDLIDLCADVILDMASEGAVQPSRIERAAVTESLIEAHRLYRSGPKNREFLLSDVVSVLRAPQRIDETQESCEIRHRVVTMISDFWGEGVYARFFDRAGALELKERFIVFDLKGLNRNPDLQRVFLKVAMLWADSVMNHKEELDNRKVLVFDEAHDLIGKTAGNVIESAFRLYRKRKGIVIAASQSGEDFYSGSGGQAIVQNSAHKIFLRQDPSKFHVTAEAFNLNKQQVEMVMNLQTVAGVESQFYLHSELGQGAFALPLEPTFYWLSTNNGDDNQLFQTMLEQCENDIVAALNKLVEMAPYGAKRFKQTLSSESSITEDEGQSVRLNRGSLFNNEAMGTRPNE